MAEMLAPAHAADSRWAILQGELRDCGHPDLTRYVAAGIEGDIHVDTQAWRRYYGRAKPTHSIVITPGQAPGDLELDLLVEEAVGAILGLTPVEIEPSLWGSMFFDPKRDLALAA